MYFYGFLKYFSLVKQIIGFVKYLLIWTMWVINNLVNCQIFVSLLLGFLLLLPLNKTETS